MKPQTCHHVHATGALCGSLAVKGRDYCHWHMGHLGRRLRAARARARHELPALVLPLPEDPIAIHAGIMQVLDAVAHNDIDPHRGRVLLTGLRFASNSLTKVGEWKQKQQQEPHPKPLFAPGENSVTEWPSFEQEHDLPPNFDLRIAPEVAFPPPSVPSVPRVGNLPLGANLRQVLDEAAAPIIENLTADDMELMEVQARDGEQAMIQRSVDQQRARRRRERREERARYEALARNHNIHIAAQQLLREEGWRAQAEAEEAKRLAGLAKIGFEDQLKEQWNTNRRKRPESQAAGDNANPAAAATGR